MLDSVAAKGVPVPYSIDLESSLRDQLFADYDVLQKPAQPVKVYVALSVMALNYMDIKTQTFSISGYFSLRWQDARLAWLENTTLLNVRLIYSNSKYMWVPPIILENAIDEIVPLGSEKVFTKINPGGYVSWLPGGNYESTCEADVTYYPLDTQTCTLTLTTMSYTLSDIKLIAIETSTEISEYTKNGEWDILSITITNSTAYTDDQAYPRIHYNFKVQRRPLYHILNTMFPVILMASLTIFVFKLPPESGERIGMSLTVLLAYAVYLTLISDDIPKTSTSVCILSVYLTIILVLSALSVILTIFVLDVYFKPDDDNVPNWLQSLTRGFLVRVTCWNAKCCYQGKQGKVTPASEKATPVGEKNVSKVSQEADELSHFEKDKNAVGYDTVGSSPHQEIDEKFCCKEIAQMLDMCFMYTYILLFVITTAICLGVLVSAY